jgi:hypothetical protein
LPKAAKVQGGFQNNMTEIVFEGQNYKEFQTSEEADAWAWKNYADILTPGEENVEYMSVFYYTGSMSRKWNSVLRRHPSIESGDFEKSAGREFCSDGEQIRRIKEVNAVLRRHYIPENIVVYRYTHAKVMKHLCAQSGIKKGTIFADKGFFSTTLIKELLGNFASKHECDCLLKIYLPNGLQGAYVALKNPLTRLNEQEILLPPNTKFEIVKIHRAFWFCKPKLIECKAVLE